MQRLNDHIQDVVHTGCCTNMLRRQIASCVLEKFCENLCLCNRILSPQQVAQIQSDLIFRVLFLRQNSLAGVFWAGENYSNFFMFVVVATIFDFMTEEG